MAVVVVGKRSLYIPDPVLKLLLLRLQKEGEEGESWEHYVRELLRFLEEDDERAKG